MVELGGVADADAVEEAVAATLVVQQQPGKSLRDSLLSFLHMKQLLVVLDNCEHLLEPAGDFVDRALRAAPRLTVLATGASEEQALNTVLPWLSQERAIDLAAEAVEIYCWDRMGSDN